MRHRFVMIEAAERMLRREFVLVETDEMMNRNKMAMRAVSGRSERAV